MEAITKNFQDVVSFKFEELFIIRFPNGYLDVNVIDFSYRFNESPWGCKKFESHREAREAAEAYIQLRRNIEGQSPIYFMIESIYSPKAE